MSVLQETTDRLLASLASIRFSKPVTHVYNPLTYARQAYDTYLDRYGSGRPEIVLLGMNPGPFGMVQTGVPFGEVEAVKDWLGIELPIAPPDHQHPKRPVLGFECQRSEVSGRRVWGWAKERFGSPERFFDRFLVLNYCPLAFVEESGRNRTPDKLAKAERMPLFEACDEALRATIAFYNPACVIGIGAFAESRALAALEGLDLRIGRITHPSPANPKANRGWKTCIEQELADLGIDI